MQEFKIPENIPFDSIDTNQYYIYAYLRENDSSVAKAGTPYYIGKGKRHRAFKSNGRCVATPKNIDNIIFIAANIESENDAYRLEKYYTDYFGRVDLGTGILRNLQDGGLGGTNPSEETRKKISEANSGEKNPMYGRTGEKSPMYGRTGEKNHMYGKSLSIETRKKISESLIGENNPNYGKSLSIETREKMSEANTGEKNPMYGRTGEKSPSFGKRWYNDGEKDYFLFPSKENDEKYNKGIINRKKTLKHKKTQDKNMTKRIQATINKDVYDNFYAVVDNYRHNSSEVLEKLLKEYNEKFNFKKCVTCKKFLSEDKYYLNGQKTRAKECLVCTEEKKILNKKNKPKLNEVETQVQTINQTLETKPEQQKLNFDQNQDNEFVSLMGQYLEMKKNKDCDIDFPTFVECKNTYEQMKNKFNQDMKGNTDKNTPPLQHFEK